MAGKGRGKGGERVGEWRTGRRKKEEGREGQGTSLLCLYSGLDDSMLQIVRYTLEGRRHVVLTFDDPLQCVFLIPTHFFVVRRLNNCNLINFNKLRIKTSIFINLL